MAVERRLRTIPAPSNVKSSWPARYDKRQHGLTNRSGRYPLRPPVQQHLRGAAALFPAAIAAKPFSILILSFSSWGSLGFFSFFGTSTGFVIGSELFDAAVDLEPKHIVVDYDVDSEWSCRYLK